MVVDIKTRKLGMKLRDDRLAALLVAAGFDGPAKVRRASDAELRAIDGIGPAALKAIRARLPKR